MIARKIFSHVTLALTVAALTIPLSATAMAGGYGYGSQTGWSGSQAHAPIRHTTRKKVYAGSNRHLAWCFNRYRSYRLMDNSFQPYHGPRQECLSPYEQERRALFVGYPDQAPEILFRDQAVAGAEPTEGDPFGNLPEGTATGALRAGGASAQADRFGNLPEQAALGADLSAGSEPVTEEKAAPAQVPQLVVTPKDEGEGTRVAIPEAQPGPAANGSAGVQSDADAGSAQPVAPATDDPSASASAQSAAQTEGQKGPDASGN
ncbi:BA14K family protein [Labrenzia sp. VG12]|uniref:BA14K family protein n=1 Tax=Labrenzia sp. VG12 TaxID=2021862 RepID=UPI000B8BECA9|nr:hypothetical protein CHH27_11835 [Labrenzia sp. VG12]